MTVETREELLGRVLQDLLEAEADYRSAMHIYLDLPLHRARIRAESRWWHAKQIAKSVLDAARPAPAAEGG